MSETPARSHARVEAPNNPNHRALNQLDSDGEGRYFPALSVSAPSALSALPDTTDTPTDTPESLSQAGTDTTDTTDTDCLEVLR